MKKVGIITYHAAYNFGSVLQAYATQRAIAELGCNVEIIDYRPVAQRRYYEQMYRTHLGLKFFVKDLFLLPVSKQRQVRKRRFEFFISNMLQLSKDTFTYPSQLDALSNKYDVVVSGSDQLFNKHSNELESEEWSAMNPYLLTFAHNSRKISYASSPASMTETELMYIKPQLCEFNALSAREKDAAELLETITHKIVPNVLDPTLLLCSQEWDKLEQYGEIKLPKQYILYYSLDATNKMVSRVKTLKSIARKYGMPILAITPFAILPYCRELLNGHAMGPCEFLSAIKYANCVLTDSYHGTLFSINYNVPFYSISTGSGSSTRKDQILHKLNLSNHIIRGLEEIDTATLSISEQPLSEESQTVLKECRSASMTYLSNAIR